MVNVKSSYWYDGSSLGEQSLWSMEFRFDSREPENVSRLGNGNEESGVPGTGSCFIRTVHVHDILSLDSLSLMFRGGSGVNRGSGERGRAPGASHSNRRSISKMLWQMGEEGYPWMSQNVRVSKSNQMPLEMHDGQSPFVVLSWATRSPQKCSTFAEIFTEVHR
jgi:hypothetical protein